MEILGWIGSHWFDLLQTTSIVVGLFTTAHSIRAETNERRIQNLFTLTEAHRDLWSKLYDKPELARVLREHMDLKAAPITREEEMFVHFLILHLGAWFKARSLGSDLDDEAVSADIQQFFQAPIPRGVWERSKMFQPKDFQEFVARRIAPTSN
jgi:hypothetical protein